MKKLAMVIMSFTLVKGFSQKKGEEYKTIAQFVAHEFINSTCQTGNQNVCQGTVFRILVDPIESENFVKIKLTKAWNCPDSAIVDKIYCVEKRIFTDGSVALTPKTIITQNWKGGLTGGVLTIPFKFDSQNFKVFPAGEIGGFGGYKISNVKNGAPTFVIGAILGLSSIPLNDLNSTKENEIKSVSGITYGAGVSVYLTQGFQFGIYYGTDLFNTDNTKYKKEWLSFGFGYDFVKLYNDVTKKN